MEGVKKAADGVRDVPTCRSPFARSKSTIRAYVRSTSKRDFVVIPIAVLAEQTLSQRRLRFVGVPFMAWGYLQYLLSGRYRSRLGGGGPGLSGPPPDRLVTSGIYSITRNPMYTGHVLFLAGLALSTGSPFALAVAIGVVPWFRTRITGDERRMMELFGTEYDNYCARVSRWGPWPASRSALLSNTRRKEASD